MRGVRSGLGAVALDDWMRRGLRMHKANRSGFWGVHQFGVPAAAAVTYSWALFPTINSTDYCASTALTFEHTGRFGVRSLAAFWPSRTHRDLLRLYLCSNTFYDDLIDSKTLDLQKQIQ